MHKTANCLNCNATVTHQFCAHCGQKTDTHRINLKHVIFQDVIQSVWYLENKKIFTIKAALTKPGQAAVDFIAGKRIKYYNILYLNLIVIGLSLFVEGKMDTLDIIYGLKTGGTEDKFDAFLNLYEKLLTMSVVPIFAFFGFVLFRKSKYNFSEHCIIAGITFLGVMLIQAFTLPLMFFKYTKDFDWIAIFFDSISDFLLILFCTFGYYTAFAKYYTKPGIAWRICLLLFFSIATMFLIVFLIMLILNAEF